MRPETSPQMRPDISAQVDPDFSLGQGVHYLAIPGPSVTPDAVLRAMHRQSPNIYEGELHEICLGLTPSLQAVARTKGDVAIYISNGHGAWEAALCNTLSRGDKVLALATGIFAHGWSDMAEKSGINVERMDFGRRAPVDPSQLEERLAADKAHEIKAVLAVQVDTSSSVKNDIAAVRAAIDRAGHPALLMVDCIACLACDRMEMDAWGVDVLVTGSQKGLMTPPGLGFVFFNDRAKEAHAQADLVTAYWDWAPRTHPEAFYQVFCGTAPTHHIYGLRTALDLIEAERIERVWRRHEMLARAVWAAVDRWAEGGALEPNIVDPAYRSHAVTTCRLPAPHGADLRRWVETKAGVTLGIGVGMRTEEDPEASGFFRIGHMGHVNAQMVMGALGAVAAGLKALGVTHGAGGLDEAAEILSTC